ncbi:putative transcription factor atf1 [Amylocarpus encephaloides]|uniref:Transcription factor atf1 n=1 Tax=Amylocarpus encephaloides TaxID=45428 RepID=A0A9P7Y8X4_9HELO|nr:putative transcription factor atf1 [Amylocarpus encephaloides]
MGKASPVVAKKSDTQSPVQTKADPPIPADGASDVKKEDAPNPEASDTDPLGPPPRPGATQPLLGTPDYFSAIHTNISTETNPFEASFAFGSSTSGGGQVQTPGGTKLPSVAALTSPAGILGTGVTPNFWGGLRSGPLSPAMLSGPQKGDDYFSDGHHLRGGFPTPNESSLRSGLTPGGGGSMFPEPSPNSQALFSQLAGGVATPTTLDFHRTAMSAAASRKREAAASQQTVTSQPQGAVNGIDVKPAVPGPFDQHDANDAANGLFLLAQQSQTRNGPQATNHYTMAPQMSVHGHPNQPPQNISMAGPSSETSPPMHSRNANGGSNSTNSMRGASEMSGGSEENEPHNRPNTRGKGRRGNSTAQTNGRRKADETPSKGPAAKKSKANNGNAMMSEPQSEEEPDLSKDEYNANGKKMTDEEKRKNFLERNRVAALKCRQRKKQWLANLQQKVEIFSSENDHLSQQISQLREEIVNLKTILMAHKDCPVSQQQGLAGIGMQQFIEGYNGQINPYGMAQPPMGAQQVMSGGQGMPDRRFS